MRTEENLIILYIDVCKFSSLTRREQQRRKFVSFFFSYTRILNFLISEMFLIISNYYLLFNLHILPYLLDKFAVLDHILKLKKIKLYLKKVDAKYLKTCLEFVLFILSSKKMMFNKTSFNRTHKKKIKS